MIWAFSGSAISKIAAAVGGYFLLHGALNNTDTWVAGFSAYTPAHAKVLGYGSSLKAVEQPANIQHNGVMLDIEKWSFTPAQEQQHPVQTYAAFYKYAQYATAGHWIVAAPAFNLVKSVIPTWNGPVYPEFLKMRWAGRIAKYAGVYVIQAQGAERNPARYAQLVDAVAEQVHAASPSTLVLAGLSMNPSGQAIPESVLMQDISAVRANVSGFWLAIPSKDAACPSCAQHDPEKAVRLITDAVMQYG